MKVRRLALVGAVVGVLLVVLWLVGGNAYARYREKQVEAEWVRSFGPLGKLLDRYPKTTANETTRQLEQLVKPLELDLSPQDPDAISRSNSASRDGESWKAVSNYLTAQLQKPGAAIEPPPTEVGNFLAAHAADLSAAEEALLTSPPPVWSFDAASLARRQKIPNLLALLRLQRALLTEALVKERAQNPAAARSLEASWKLNQTLREVPDLVCQLIALAVARLQVGALRKAEVDQTVWRARLAEYDFKRSVFDTQLLDRWPSVARRRELQTIESRSPKAPLERLKNTLEEPYADIVWSRVVDKMRLAYLRINESNVLSDEVWKADVPARETAADMLLSTAMVNSLDCFRRVDRLVIESELTDKVLQARQLRRENDLKWPAAVPGIEATRFPGAHWIYSISPQGVMSISLSQEPNWQASGLVLPSRFTSS